MVMIMTECYEHLVIIDLIQGALLVGKRLEKSGCGLTFHFLFILWPNVRMVMIMTECYELLVIIDLIQGVKKGWTNLGRG